MYGTLKHNVEHIQMLAATHSQKVTETYFPAHSLSSFRNSEITILPV
jgi:hypothetical protein